MIENPGRRPPLWNRSSMDGCERGTTHRLAPIHLQLVARFALRQIAARSMALT
jgi:hypothetical protein